MKLRHLLAPALLLGALPAVAAAEDIAYFTSTLTSASPTELGRGSRSGIQQTWLGAETYTGIINATTIYNYTTFTFAASSFVGASYVEISFYDSLNGTSLFSTAYSGSYSPASPGANWLGDQGSSGNFFNVVPRYYDVILPAGSNLVLLVNDTAAAGLNDPFTIDVSAYADTNYNDPAPVVTPEPSTLITMGTGMLGLLGIYRRRRKSSGLPCTDYVV